MPHTVVAVEVRPRHVRARRVPMTWRSVCDHTPACCAHCPIGLGGGELSRIMLAIEVAIAQAVPGPRPSSSTRSTRYRWPRRPRRRGSPGAARQHSQVTVVTHLAQVAARRPTPGRAQVRRRHAAVIRTEVHRVEGAARLEELARMLGGTDSAAASNTHVTSWTGGRSGRPCVGEWAGCPHACDHCETVTPTMRGSAVRSGRQTHEEPDQAASAREIAVIDHRPRQGQRRGLGCLSTGSRHQRRSVDQWSLSQSRAGNPRRCGHPAARQCGQGGHGAPR